MKLPRDLGGRGLAKELSRYGYQITRQTGSHLRLTTTREGEPHLTIPAHDALRVDTLSAILDEVAVHFKRSRTELMQELWG